MQDRDVAEEKDTVTFAEPREFAPEKDEESFIEEDVNTLAPPSNVAAPVAQGPSPEAESSTPPFAFIAIALLVVGGLIGAAVYST